MSKLRNGEWYPKGGHDWKFRKKRVYKRTQKRSLTKQRSQVDNWSFELDNNIE